MRFVVLSINSLPANALCKLLFPEPHRIRSKVDNYHVLPSVTGIVSLQLHTAVPPTPCIQFGYGITGESVSVFHSEARADIIPLNLKRVDISVDKNK